MMLGGMDSLWDAGSLRPLPHCAAQIVTSVMHLDF